MITASAPGRCVLVGDPSDMFGGSILACSTQERARCTLSPDAEGIVITVSGMSQTVESISDLTRYPGDPLNVARTVLAALEVSPGLTPPFHLTAETGIPANAGLAGTTAILATITGCLLTYLELRLNSYEIAELIHKIEADFLGVQCGFEGHYMTVFGGLSFMEFRDKSSSEPQLPTTPFATVEPLERFMSGLPFVLAGTADSLAFQDSPRESDQTVREGCMEAARLARGAKRALLARDWESLADLMNRNHTILRQLKGTSDAEEKLIGASLEGGALGAKSAGAGGMILALASDMERTVEALRAGGADTILLPQPSPGLTVSIEVTV